MPTSKAEDCFFKSLLFLGIFYNISRALKIAKKYRVVISKNPKNRGALLAVFHPILFKNRNF